VNIPHSLQEVNDSVQREIARHAQKHLRNLGYYY